jgi:hypothetical protein
MTTLRLAFTVATVHKEGEMPTIKTTCIAAVLAAGMATGCGGEEPAANAAGKQAIQPGAVFFEDALDDNANGWLEVDKLVHFDGGKYVWKQIPDGQGGGSGADKAFEDPAPDGLSISVDANVTRGAALRTVTCRELGTPEELQDWYELGIDGRRALIRRMTVNGPPKVLKAVDAPVENRRSVRITGHCVPDGKKLVLALALDGREVARVTDNKPLPAARDGLRGTFGLHAYRRPDSDGPADMTWDAFDVRTATLAQKH